MEIKHKISTRFIKKDWGGGRKTWRRASMFDYSPVTAIRPLTNKQAKKAVLMGFGLKAY